MKSFESWMLGYLLNSVWQIPLLFSAAWLVARAARSSGAVVEHRVWVSALVLQSLLPGYSVQPWHWLRGLSAWASRTDDARDGQVSVVMGPGVGFGTLHLPAVLLVVIAFAYSAIFLYFSARLLWGLWRTSRLRREAVPIALTTRSAMCWTGCSKRFGVHDATLAASPSIPGPITMGMRRKLLLLPEHLITSLREEDLHTVIAHEFAHMYRRDYAKNLLYELLSLSVAYHPLFWATRARVTESREVVCDQMAAEAVAGPEKYARSLLRLASMLIQGKSAWAPHAIGIFDANVFERRIMKLTLRPREIQGTQRLAILAACVAFGMGTCASALALRTVVYGASMQSAGEPASGKDAPTAVPAGVMAGNLLLHVMPKYPQTAKDAKIEGVVVLHAIVGKEGLIENLQVVSGPKELLQSSLDAVQQWTYKPYLLNGYPVEVDTTVTVRYSVQH